MSKQNKRVFAFGPFTIDTVNRQLLREGELVPLKAKAVDILLLLIDNCGDVFEKDDLMKALWPDSFVEDANLTQNIYTLRKALGERDYIETIPRRGYRFVAKVEEIEDETPDLIVIKEKTSTRVSFEEEVEPSSRELNSSAIHDGQRIIDVTSVTAALQLPQAAPSSRFRRWWLVLALAAASVAVVAVAMWMRRPGIPFANVKLVKFTTTGKAVNVAISPDGKLIAFVQSDSGQQGIWLRQLITGKELPVVPAQHTDIYGLTFTRDGSYIFYVSQEQNKLGILYQVPSLGGTPDKLIEDVDTPVTFSPDNKQLAFLRFSPGAGSIVIANTDGSGERTLATTHYGDAVRIGPNGVLPPSWSPDGNIIACPVSINSNQWDQAIYGFQTSDGANHQLTTNHWPAVGRIEWAPDGSGILVTASETEITAIQQIWFVPYPKGEARRITNDLMDYRDLSIAADTRTLVTIQSERKANIWLAPATDLDHPTQLTATSYDGLNGLSWTPEGNLVYTSQIAGEQNLWITDLNGGAPKQLTAHTGFNEQPVVSPDGRYIVFLSNRDGQEHLWRIDIDGKHALKLTYGTGDRQPTFTADGQAVIYRSSQPSHLFRVSINGGAPVQLTDRSSFDPNVSPDGKLIACGYRPEHAIKNQVGIIPINGGEPKPIADWPAQYGRLRWTPDGRALAYAARQAGVGNIWIQPLDGSAPRQLTHWNANPILSFGWSPDGKSLAYANGTLTSDVVMISDASR